MSTKKDFEKWGKIFAQVGGAFFIIGGIFLILNIFLMYALGTLESNLLVKGFFLSMININGVLGAIIVATITILLGLAAIVLTLSKMKDFWIAILLIIVAIVGLGLSGLLVFIGGILYLIASFK